MIPIKWLEILTNESIFFFHFRFVYSLILPFLWIESCFEHIGARMSYEWIFFMEKFYIIERLSGFWEGKSEDKVDIDWNIFSFWSFDTFRDRIQRLDDSLFRTSVNSFQGCIIEALYSEWNSIDSEIEESCYIFSRYILGVTFKTNFSFTWRETIEYFFYFKKGKYWWCSTSEI